MAARDRFSSPGDLGGASTLQRYIKQACSLENFEPNLALNLEIADLINSKKGNAPREAAMAIVSQINHRNPNVSLLALNLLDICVKNCGYPFQLQISMKEFLNELVRRFPERPPLRPSKVQMKILEAIEEWRGTICQTSRYKDDLGYIRDMHRLLSYKGYVFPEIKREDAAVLNPSDALKSAEEMEEEEKAAQSAKLQELIRRGGPQDLQEANRLMKIMAGYDTRQKTDYRAKAVEEVIKVQKKAKLLEERLEYFKPGDNMTEGDIFEELAAALQSAHPKIQKMCEEESDDHEAVAKLLEINDSINRTVERYKLMKKGDILAASKIARGTLGTSSGVNSQNELSLIDLDFDTEVDRTTDFSAPTGLNSRLEDDLLGLSMEGNDELSGSNFPVSGKKTTNYNLDGGLSFSTLAVPSPSISLGSQSGTELSAIGSTQNPPNIAKQQISLLYPQACPSQSAHSSRVSPLSNSSSTLLDINRIMLPDTPSKSNLTAMSNSTAASSLIPAGTVDDEEWAFSSALPEGLPSSNTITINHGAMTVSLHATRLVYSQTEITISLSFSNTISESISELTFMAAVTKGYQLKLQPQSGRTLQPHEQNGITQVITLSGVEQGKGDTVRLRWKANYKVGNMPVCERGEIASLGIA